MIRRRTRHLGQHVRRQMSGSVAGRTVAECSIERNGADVAAVMRSLELSPAVLVGHSVGCCVVVEAALQLPRETAGIIPVDGSQFAAAMEPVLTERAPPRPVTVSVRIGPADHASTKRVKARRMTFSAGSIGIWPRKVNRVQQVSTRMEVALDECVNEMDVLNLLG
jgi:pimeloyl-ACP methyl ester carboxylesterase